MTTKPKTRKSPAKAAAPVKGKAPGEQKREISDIRKLLSRWHWLEADQEHRSDLAKTENESERFIAMHQGEQEAIETQLATLVPATFDDAYCLLKFATGRVEQVGGMTDFVEIVMLKHALAGLHPVWGDELKAERNKALMEFREGLAALLDIFNEPRHLRAFIDTLDRKLTKAVDDRRAA